MEIQSDATEKGSRVVRLDLDVVRDIENDLLLYEKVSLVFLLYKQEDTALQWLLIEIANSFHNTSTNLITNWAKSKETSNWKRQFIEALSIVQNYAVLQRLGYNKKEIQIDYLPQNPYTSLYINNVRKAFYYICENLTCKQRSTFLQHLRQSFAEKSIEYPNYNNEYLEIYFLHCFSIKFITTNHFTNVMLILKKMNLTNMSDILEKIMNDNSNLRISTKLDVDSNCSDSNSITPRSYSESECYKIDRKNVGICVIVNQKTFYKETDPQFLLDLPLDHELNKRTGTDVDSDTLTNTFQAFGFRVELLENKTHLEIQTGIREAIEKFTFKDSCFIVCILSHGIKDAVYGINSIPVKITKLESILHDEKYKALLGKPKVLIIQSCQGKPLQEVAFVPKTNDYNVTDGITAPLNKYNLLTAGLNCVPEKADLLVCSSTVPGYASIRNEKTGSWYIQELCERIRKQYQEKHFTDILLSVNREVSKKRWLKDNKYVCMMPEYKTSFRKFLYLPDINSN